MTTSCCKRGQLPAGSFSRFPSRAAGDTRLGGPELHVLMLICRHMGNGTLACSMSVPTMVQKLGLSESSVRRAIRVLEGAGYLQVIRKMVPRGAKNLPNCYHVIFEAGETHNCTGDGITNLCSAAEIPVTDDTTEAVTPVIPDRKTPVVDDQHYYTKTNYTNNPPLSQDTTYPSKETPQGGSNLLFHPAVEEEDRMSVEFADWYKHYPKKVGKAHAEKAYRIARKRKRVSQEDLVRGVKNYIERKRRETRRGDPIYANPATWLNGECWLDEVWQPAALSPGQKLDLMAAGDKSVTEEMKQEWWSDPEVRAEYSRRNSRNAV